MKKFGNFYVENIVDNNNVPLLGEPDDLLLIKQLPLRFDIQNPNDPDVKYRYSIDTDEKYQATSSTLLSNGQINIIYLSDNPDAPYNYIKLIWELDNTNGTINLIAKEIEAQSTAGEE